MNNDEYFTAYKKLSWNEFEINCSSSNLVSGLKDEFNGDYDKFLKEFDFMAFYLPVHPELFTPSDWDKIQDFLSDCHSERCEAALFKRNPEAIDPRDY